MFCRPRFKSRFFEMFLDFVCHLGFHLAPSLRKNRSENHFNKRRSPNTNEENTGLIVLIKNMKSRKYQKQKREAEIMKRNLLFEFKQIHGDKEPYLFVRQYPIKKKVGRKRTRQGYYKKIEKQIVLSFN